MKGGIPLNEPNRHGDESKRYIIGADVEYSLFGGFAVEVGFLYRRHGSSNFNAFGRNLLFPLEGVLQLSDRSRSDAFEVPVLGKYYFKRGAKWRPFFSTGYAFRKSHTEGESALIRDVEGTLSTARTSYSFWKPLNIGAVFGAGIRWKTGRVSFVPEVRYTRWGEYPSPTGRKDQADFLLGIRF